TTLFRSAREDVQVGGGGGRDRCPALGAPALDRGAVVAVALIVGDHENDIRPRARRRGQTADPAAGTDSAGGGCRAAGAPARLGGAAWRTSRLVGGTVEGARRLAEASGAPAPPHGLRD